MALIASGNQQTDPAPVIASRQNDAIWNPNAAANWSIVFTPAFGSYLQMLNWKALGQPNRAAAAQKWFYASLVVLVIYPLLTAFSSDPRGAESGGRGLAMLYLFVWYVAAGRSQAKFVKEHVGSNYPKKPWGKTLLIGIAAFVAYVIFAGVLALTLGVAGVT